MTTDITSNRNHLISFLKHEEALELLTRVSTRLDNTNPSISVAVEDYEFDEMLRSTFDTRKQEDAQREADLFGAAVRESRI